MTGKLNAAGINSLDWEIVCDVAPLADVLPVVSNPAIEISLASKVKSKGKVPSMLDSNGRMVGIANWTRKTTTQKLIDKWAAVDSYGICLQTRLVRGIDIDVENEARSAEIVAFIEDELGFELPRRYRAGTGKCLLAVRIEGELGKRSFRCTGGLVEFLAGGQQFVFAGNHFNGKGEPTGTRYEWDWGLVPHIPTIGIETFDALWEKLFNKFTSEGEKQSGRHKEGVYVPRKGEITDVDAIAEAREARSNDSILAALDDKGLVLEYGRGGEAYINCPWKALHSGDSGVTETAYFPAGTRGYELGHFKCLHAHCLDRTDSEYIEKLGLRDDEFDDLDPLAHDAPRQAPKSYTTLQITNAALKKIADPSADYYDLLGDENTEEPVTFSPPQLVAGKDVSKHVHDGEILERPVLVSDAYGSLPNINNLKKCVQLPHVSGLHIAFDDFKGDITVSDYGSAADTQVRSLTDNDYTAIQLELEKKWRFKPIALDLLRRSVDYVAGMNKYDSAQNWLTSLRWDGVNRVERFLIDYFGCAKSTQTEREYAAAISNYIWTAMAGRIMMPGSKADMVPILEGAQGTFKTTAIAAMVPDIDFFTGIDLSLADDDLARLMRGKILGEIGELRGLHTKDLEAVKDFVTRTHDRWVPKYKERSVVFARRIFFIATTNDAEFLSDSTGERRWLPIHIKRADIAALRRDRDQLWAEALALWETLGIMHQDAEALAPEFHSDYKIADPWEDIITEWLHTSDFTNLDSGSSSRPCDKPYITLHEIMRDALKLDARNNKGFEAKKVGKILRSMGYVRKTEWIGERPQKVWVKS